MHYLHNISIRRFAKRDLEQFAQTVGPQITGAALNLAVITDTHDRTQLSRTFYGQWLLACPRTALVDQ
nr:hypothetical protein [Lacticaseibacillus manihotivorans]